jgi:F-box/WD-40 domain protein 7
MVGGVRCLQGHEEIVWAVEVHGHRLFSASADKTIRVWDVDSRRCEHVLEDHTRPVLSLAINGNRLYSGSYDFTIKVSWAWQTAAAAANSSEQMCSMPCICCAHYQLLHSRQT